MRSIVAIIAAGVLSAGLGTASSALEALAQCFFVGVQVPRPR